TPTTILRKCGAAKAVGAAPAAPKPVCGGEARCIEVTPFAATITDFRVSKAGGNDKIVSFTVRFLNKTQSPLILGYVQQSGLVLDDQGVRFGAYGTNALRGIGSISGSTFDPKFVLQPGEAGDARVEVASRTQQGTIFGTVYDAEFAVREIEPLPGDQYQLGREHLLQWKGLAPAATPAVASGGGAAGASPAPAGEVAAPAQPEGDACRGAPRCYGAGPFTATVTQVTTSKSGGYQTMRIAVKVRNVAAEPMILGFKAGAQTSTDDVGDRLRSKNDGVKGIGLVTGGSADPQFRLAPGQERGFTLDYYKGLYKGTVLGTTWGADFVLTQLEILPSQQVRVVRDYAIGFTELRGGGGATAAAGTTGSDAAAVVNTLGRLIKKK
ncbi:MAG: hypothetical protein MUC69_05850, partial [Gemmatimonadales bacterium]|nr:hypothetical protein [Gemmatimonadales bacterium]